MLIPPVSNKVQKTVEYLIDPNWFDGWLTGEEAIRHLQLLYLKRISDQLDQLIVNLTAPRSITYPEDINLGT